MLIHDCYVIFVISPPVSFIAEFIVDFINFSEFHYHHIATHPFNTHINTAEQRTIIRQYGYWYTGRLWVDCYIWYSEEGLERAGAPPIPLLAVPNVTVYPSTASVPTSCYLCGTIITFAL